MWNHKMKVRVGLNERVLVAKDNLPIRALGPGVHTLRADEQVSLVLDIDALIFEARAEERAVMPAAWFAEVAVTPRERAVISEGGRPVRALSRGVHRYWTIDESVKVDLFPLDEPPPDDPRVLKLLGAEVVQVVIGQHQRGLLFSEGRFERVLEPGRHVYWNTATAPSSVNVVDMRRQILAVSGQELMTRDKVSLRLSVTVEWAPLDPALHLQVAADPKAALYALVQLALREFVAGVTLDELLEGRDALTVFLRGQVTPAAEQLGMKVTQVGLKDVMLPGEMKVLFNRVIEAEKQAAANAILRREEAAHTRTQANAAQLMADRPMLLRLKELEALENIAGRIDELKVVMGADGLKGLLPRREG